MKNLIQKIITIIILSFSISVEATRVTYFHTDSLGSPNAATDESGNVKWRERYTPFGEKLDATLESKDNRVGYTGHQFDDETQLVYMQARYYDPVIGRFYSNDPLGFRDIHSFNRYAYGNNNPYKYVDPDGENPKLIADFVLNVALNVGTTGELGLASAAKETVKGALNPLSTVNKAKKLYITYTKVNKKTGEVYSGRTSGKGEPGKILNTRDAKHHKNDDDFGKAQIDKVSTNKDAIRGREQQLIEANGGAKSQKGTSGNAINGISDKNPNRQKYTDAANKEFN